MNIIINEHYFVDDDIFTAHAAEAARPFDIFVDLFFRSGAFGSCLMPLSEHCLCCFCCGGVTASDSPKSLITRPGISLYSSGNICVNDVQSSSSVRWVLLVIDSLSMLLPDDEDCVIREFTISCNSEAHSCCKQLLAPVYLYGAVMYVIRDSISFGVTDRFCDG